MSLKMNRKEGGFTLIELLVVIAIIGILSSVVLASLNSARSSSRDARRQTDLQQISLALELFYDSCGAYPNASGNALTTGAQGGTCSGSGDATFGDFMGTIPDDPQDDTEYPYAPQSSNASYCLGATLEGSNTPDNHDTSCASTLNGISGVSGVNYAISP